MNEKLLLSDVDATRRPRKMCDLRAEQGQRNRAVFLDAIRAGATIREACRAAGWRSESTYRKNRRRYPAWASTVDYERGVALTGDRGLELVRSASEQQVALATHHHPLTAAR